jgi:hypothetical protein
MEEATGAWRSEADAGFAGVADGAPRRDRADRERTLECSFANCCARRR